MPIFASKLESSGQRSFSRFRHGTRGARGGLYSIAADDYIVPYYRDRVLVLAVAFTRELGLDISPSANTGSGGRMSRRITAAKICTSGVSPRRPVHSFCRAAAMAWGMQLDGKTSVVVPTVGDAASRQGDFYEAVCFAKGRNSRFFF